MTVTPQESGEPRALRLTFTFRGDEVRLVSRQPVTALTPPSDPLETVARQGFWAELQDGAARPVFRRVMRDPASGSAEVFGPGESPVRAPVDEVRGVFSVLVPDDPRARDVVLHSSSAGAGATARRAEAAQGRAAVEWARFGLREERP